MMKKTALLPFSALAFATALTAASTPAAACGTEAYFGQVCIMATTYCPQNTLELNGQMLQIAEYQALYSLLGCTFGGDCRSTFQLPDLRGRMPVHYGQGIGLTPRPFGKYFGQEGVSQTAATLAPHNHSVTVSGGGGSAQVNARQVDGTANVPQAGSMLAQGLAGLDSSNIYVDPAASPGTDVALGGVSGGGAIGSVIVGIAGAGAPIPTVPPETAVRYCIVGQGIYPPRP